MLELMGRNNSRVGRGHPIEDNGLWLDGPMVNNEFVSRVFENQFSEQRMLLAKHLCVFKQRGPITNAVSEGDYDDNSYD
jgi:hypothetical protein